MCIRAKERTVFRAVFPLIGSARALNSRGCYPICPIPAVFLINCCFSAPKTSFCFQLSQTDTQSPAYRKRRSVGGGSTILSTATERAAQFPISAGCGIFAPQSAVFQVHGSVNNSPQGAVTFTPQGAVISLRRVRKIFPQGCGFLIRRIAKAFSVVLIFGENVPPDGGIGARKLVPSAIRGGKPSGYSFHGSLPRLGKLADFIACRLI